MKIQVQIDLKDALNIMIDGVTNEGLIRLYVAYNSGCSEYHITVNELRKLCDIASFQFIMPDNIKTEEIPF